MGLDTNLVINMKLTSKISIVLVVLVLISGTLIGVLCVENIADAFDTYLFEAYEVMLDEWARTFVAYYASNGSWSGIVNLKVNNMYAVISAPFPDV